MSVLRGEGPGCLGRRGEQRLKPQLVNEWLEIPDRSKVSQAGPVERVPGRPGAELLVSADRLYCDGEFLAAARDFRRARSREPTLFDAWAWEVFARVRARDMAAAAACADEALETYGRVAVFYAAKALVLAHQGNPDDALHYSDIAVKHGEDNMLTWLSRGEVFLATRAYGVASGVERCFQEASARDPSRWRAKFEAALCFFQWENYPRAIERLGEVAQLVPRNPFVQKLIGDCQRHSGELAAAREAYRLALARRPDYRPALEALRAMTLWGRVRGALSRLLGGHKG